MEIETVDFPWTPDSGTRKFNFVHEIRINYWVELGVYTGPVSNGFRIIGGTEQLCILWNQLCRDNLP